MLHKWQIFMPLLMVAILRVMTMDKLQKGKAGIILRLMLEIMINKSRNFYQLLHVAVRHEATQQHPESEKDGKNLFHAAS